MSAINDGGQAFPVSDQGVHGSYGMSLRDYFAAKAMQAMNSNKSWDDQTFAVIAKDAYEQADAMLAARGAA